MMPETISLNTGANPIRLSCVTTLYKSERFVEEFVRRCDAAARLVTDSYEIILVDDGSPDRSRQIGQSLATKFPNLRVIELSRNFGHHPAILAGLEASRGEMVFLIDSDLEEAPELLVSFYQHLVANADTDVVYGFHRRQDETPLRKLTSGTFWKVFSRLSDVTILPNLANVRLMKRNYVDALVAMPDRNVFLGGMFSWPGFRQEAVEVMRQQRADTSYSWRARMRLASLAAVSFTKTPLLAAFWLGMGIAMISFAIGVFVLLQRLMIGGAAADGWSSLMLSIWFLGGLIMGSIGVVGLYIAQIFDQVRGRPRFIVRSDTLGRGD